MRRGAEVAAEEDEDQVTGGGEGRHGLVTGTLLLWWQHLGLTNESPISVKLTNQRPVILVIIPWAEPRRRSCRAGPPDTGGSYCRQLWGGDTLTVSPFLLVNISISYLSTVSWYSSSSSKVSWSKPSSVDGRWHKFNLASMVKKWPSGLMIWHRQDVPIMIKWSWW